MRDEGPFIIFASDQSTKVVFRRITEGARNCWPHLQIDADYFPDNNTAQISMSFKHDLVISALFVANISPNAQSSTVRVAFLKNNRIYADTVQAWANGSEKCPI